VVITLDKKGRISVASVEGNNFYFMSAVNSIYT